MAYEIPGKMITLPASSNMSAHQFKLVTVNASGQATLSVSTAGPSVLGVLQSKPTAAGDAASVMIDGVTKIQAAASTLSVGDIFGASSAGLAVPLVAGDYAVGRIIDGTSGAARVLTAVLQSIGTT